MPADDAQYRRIEKIQRAALSAHEMVLHVLDEAPGASQIQPVDVHEQIRAFVHIVDGILSDSIQLKLDLSAEDGQILAEVKDLHRVLLNLISNASQAMPEGGTLMIQTARVSCSRRRKDSQDADAAPIDAIRISVRDTGNGIPPSKIERIFEPGYTTKVGGNGLGLACVQRIAKHYGGWVEVDSIPNVGTAIHIFLPHCPTAATASIAV
jgi:signal transduction histidine kinase